MTKKELDCKGSVLESEKPEDIIICLICSAKYNRTEEKSPCDICGAELHYIHKL